MVLTEWIAQEMIERKDYLIEDADGNPWIEDRKKDDMMVVEIKTIQLQAA